MIRRKGIYLAIAFLAGMATPALLAQDSAKVLLNDPLNQTVTHAGKVFSKAKVFTSPDKLPGGQVQGKVEPVDGRALRFSGLSQVEYFPTKGNIDLTGGELSFSVCLNFDPMAKTERNKTALSNQSFLTVWGSQGYNKVCIYNSGLDRFAVTVTNDQGSVVFSESFNQVWKPGQWHSLGIRWGRELEFRCDGEKKASAPWSGLFGPVAVDSDKLRIYLGSQIGWTNVESEFTIKDLVIRGPGPGQISLRPRLALPLLTDRPVLDGSLTDPFWAQAARVTGFSRYDKNSLATLQPAVYAAYTHDGIYFGLEATLPPGIRPRALLTARDSGIPLEDSVEVLLQPHGPGATIYHFIGSAIGTQYDCKGKGKGTMDVGYNPDWTIKTQGAPGRWTAELFIPFAALDGLKMPRPGDVWKGNFCLDSANGYSNAVTWSFISGNFSNDVYFGELLFTGGPRAIRQTDFGGFVDGEPHLRFDVAGDYSPVITMHGELFDATGKSVYKNDLPLRDTKTAVVKPPFLTAGTYTMVLSAAEDSGASLFFQTFAFRTAKAFDLSVTNYPYAGYLQMRVNGLGLRERWEKVVCTLTGSSHAPLATVELRTVKPGIGEGRLTNDNLTPGDYTVEARAMSKEGKVLATARQSFKVFPHPVWWKSTMGIDHSVPPPFEPVRATAAKASVWGRDYTFDQSVLVRQIRNQGMDLFVRPPDFQITLDGQSVDLGRMQAIPETTYPDAASRVGRQQVGSVLLTGKTTVEFDGFLRYDLTITPSQATRLERMVLSMPLAPALARHLLTSTGASDAITTLDHPFAGGFYPHLWVGNDAMGLAWCAETDEYWNPKDRNMIQVIPGKDATILRFNYVLRPIILNGPVTLSFGLMATPVRPVAGDDPFVYPSYHGSGSFPFAEFLVYPLAGHIQPQQGTLEFWVRRTEANSNGARMDIFHITNGKTDLACRLLTPAQPNVLNIALNGKSLLDVPVEMSIAAFGHMALTWDADGVCCYWNGTRAGKITGAAAAQFRQALTGGSGELRFGTNDYLYGYTGMVLDDLRVSRAVRYRGDRFAVPASPLANDSDTLLLDPLDETFTPDGQDAETKPGGVPSIGCSFAPAKFASGLKIQVGPPRPALDVMKEMGVKVSMPQWIWQNGDKYGWPPVLFTDGNRDLKDLVADHRRHGIKSVLYMAYPAIGAPSPLADQFADEWSIIPASTTPEIGPPGHYMLMSCLKAKGFADYLTAGTAWLIDQFDIDGDYTDGLAHVYACQNQAHGCGYVDASGTLHPTWPVFSVRDGLKRMYRTVRARKPDGFFVNHASFSTFAPSLSFSDVVYVGEHEDYENLLNARVRFNSRPWGLYITLLGNDQHSYEPLYEMIPLLTGTSVWATNLTGSNDISRKDAALRRAYAAFDIRSAVWVPYFEGEGRYYQVDDPKVKVSLYYHSGRNILLLAANLNPQAVKAVIRLDLKEMGLRDKNLTAVNALTAERIEMAAKGEMPVTIKSKSFRLIRIEAR